MPNIHLLSPHIANQIAAGEVVERPCSIVKELVENAVDARATAVIVEIENGGLDRIRISDNGTGIADEDCETAFLRHATSKIASTDDLARIATLGFRGEALASIAAVSRVCMTTRTVGDDLGTQICMEGGVLKEHRRAGGTVGTSIEVTSLFYNVPARLKFLKSPRSESGAIGDYMAKAILSLPNISFRFVNNGKEIYRSTGDGSLLNALISIYGVEIAAQLCPVSFDDGYLKIDGFIGTPELSRANRTGQALFLNGRIIRSSALSAALSRAFDTRLLIGRYPFAALEMRLALAEADVNVHPAKLEVRFVDEGRVTRSVCAACSEGLIRSYVPNAQFSVRAAVDDDATDSDDMAHDHSDGVRAYADSERLPHSVELRKPFAPVSHVRESADCFMADESLSRKSCALRGEASAADIRQIRHGVQEDLFFADSARGEVPFAEPYTVIGAAFQAYWFVQQGENVYCIDQHAAHERLLYDALSEKRMEIVSQAMLIPETMTLIPSDHALFAERRRELESIGYVFAEGTDGELPRITLAATPQLNGIALKGKFLLDILHGHDFSRGMLMQTACKHAIKAGEPISREEMDALLTALSQSDSLLTCPHGRPVAVRISKLDLEKMFQRVV